MKRAYLFLVVTFLALGFVKTASATLTLIDGSGYNLVVDDASGHELMWYDSFSDGLCPSTMTYSEAETWAAGLTAGGYDDWRLPTYFEFKHLFETYQIGPSGFSFQVGYGGPIVSMDPSPFDCSMPYYGYWTDTLVDPSFVLSGTISDWTYIWPFLDFDFTPPVILLDPPSATLKNNDLFYAYAVRAVPIPGAIWLMVSGLIGLVGIRRKIRGD